MFKHVAAAIGFLAIATLVGAATLYWTKVNNKPCATMPIVKANLPPIIEKKEPIAKRGLSVVFYLQNSVRVRTKNVTVKDRVGSGTIVHYDDIVKEAYVISCGHVFSEENDEKTPSDNKNIELELDIFYKNYDKLEYPEIFKGELICFSTKYDISLIKFRPDWELTHCFSIAPSNYVFVPGQIYESTGCDFGSIPASYTVELVGKLGHSIVTRNNSPRKGRSGGGLLTQNGYFIAIVWATSAVDGTGYGFYIPLPKIREYLNQYNETRWILYTDNESTLISDIPISDRNNYPSNYIPVPFH